MKNFTIKFSFVRFVGHALCFLIYSTSAQSQNVAPSHCTPEETNYFSCSTGKKLISYCGSKKITSKEGYLQYRFGSHGKIEISLPKDRDLAAKTFDFSSELTPRGDVDYSLSIESGDIAYNLLATLQSRNGDENASLYVVKNGKGQLAQITCKEIYTNKLGQLEKLNAAQSTQTNSTSTSGNVRTISGKIAAGGSEANGSITLENGKRITFLDDSPVSDKIYDKCKINDACEVTGEVKNGHLVSVISANLLKRDAGNSKISQQTQSAQGAGAVVGNDSVSPIRMNISFRTRATGFGQIIENQHDSFIDYSNLVLKVRFKVVGILDESYSINVGEISGLVISQPTKAGVENKGIKSQTDTFRLKIIGYSSNSFSNRKQSNMVDFQSLTDLEEIKKRLVASAKTLGKTIDVKYE